MSDADRRALQRAAVTGDAAAAAKLNREDARRGVGVVGFLSGLVGKQIWIEGVRINYRGVLREILDYPDGSVAALVLAPLQRVSYFQRSGPDAAYTYTHTRPHLVPYEVIHDIGEEGFAEGSWKPIEEPIEG